MTLRGENTRQRLIDATTALVRQLGYANVTTRAIAAAADVAEGTLYRHFSDKRSLFMAAVMERNAPILAASASLPSLAGTGTVLGNLTTVLRTIALLQTDIVPLEQAMISDPTLLPIPGEGQQIPVGGPPFDVAQYLAAEQSLGRVRADCDPTLAAVSLLAMLYGLGIHPITGSALAESPLLDSAVRFFVNGVAETPGTTARSDASS